jgi:hypothetical protein
MEFLSFLLDKQSRSCHLQYFGDAGKDTPSIAHEVHEDFPFVLLFPHNFAFSV